MYNLFKPVLFVVIFNLLCVINAGAAGVSITGSGSQPLSRLYIQWAEKYQSRNEIPVTYKITNVVQGLQDLENNAADFAGTEIPQTKDELAKKNQFQFPTALVGFTPFTNIAGVHNNDLVLDAATLSGIFLGNIKKWNDPQIVALNPKLSLPNAEIKTVHRNTGNTITYALSSYLTKTNSEWASKIGTGSKINWPIGQEVSSNDDLINYVKDTPNAIGFTMLSLVIKHRLNVVKFKNTAGNIITATPDTIMAAARNAKWETNNSFYNILINMPGANTWPFVMTGYVTISSKTQNIEHYKTLIHFFENSLLSSPIQAVAADLIPLPDEIISTIRSALKEHLKTTQTK